MKNLFSCRVLSVIKEKSLSSRRQTPGGYVYNRSVENLFCYTKRTILPNSPDI